MRPSPRPPRPRCRICGKRFYDYARKDGGEGRRVCPRGALHKRIVEELRDVPPPAVKSKVEHLGHFFRVAKRRRKDPLVEKLAARARRKRWEAKQDPATLAALAERRRALYKPWRREKLKEDPEWGKKRYRKYKR